MLVGSYETSVMDSEDPKCHLLVANGTHSSLVRLFKTFWQHLEREYCNEEEALK